MLEIIKVSWFGVGPYQLCSVAASDIDPCNYKLGWTGWNRENSGIKGSLWMIIKFGGKSVGLNVQLCIQIEV